MSPVWFRRGAEAAAVSDLYWYSAPSVRLDCGQLLRIVSAGSSRIRAQYCVGIGSGVVGVLKLTVVKAHVVSACHESHMLPSKPINVLGATIITGVRPMAKSSIMGAGVRLRINGSEHLLQSSRGSRSASEAGAECRGMSASRNRTPVRT